MNRNVGNIDGVLRIIIGVALLAWAFQSSSPAHWWGLIGLVPLATALLRICPLYSILGVSTCKVQPVAKSSGQ